MFGSVFTSAHDTTCSAILYISLTFPSQLSSFLFTSTYALCHFSTWHFPYFSLYLPYSISVYHTPHCIILKLPLFLTVVRIYFLLITFFFPVWILHLFYFLPLQDIAPIFISYFISALLHFGIWHFSFIFCLHSVSNSLIFCAHHFSHSPFLILHVYTVSASGISPYFLV
jgi:hypothetical protein